MALTITLISGRSAPPAEKAPEAQVPPDPPPTVPPVPVASTPVPVPTLPSRKGPRKEVAPKAQKVGARAVDLLVLSGVEAQFAAGLIDWLLQETCGKAPAKAPQTPEEDSDYDVLLRRYRLMHKTVMTVEANLLVQDLTTAKRLLKKHGLDTVLQQLQALAAVEDAFVQQQGFTFTVLERNWSRLAAGRARAKKLMARPAPAGCRHEPPCQTAEEHSQRYLREANVLPSPGRTSKRLTT